jgi:pimeloyl-ACP methyl ester carboxylesterase
MQLSRYCTAGLLVLLLATGASAQAPAEPAQGDSTLTVFLRGADAGRTQVNLSRAGANWVITSTGRVGDLTINQFRVTYTADWQPVDMRIEAMQGQRALRVSTSFGVTTAISEVTQGDQTSSKTDQISARAVVLPNGFFGGYEALAARLSVLKAGTELPIYVAPQAEVKMTISGVTNEPVQTPAGIIPTRRYDVVVHNVGADVAATVSIDARARFIRMDMPAAGLSVIRSDLADVNVRPVLARNKTDADVTIPASGFSLAGTLTSPPQPGRLKHPAVVLVPGSGPVERDETVSGIPIFAQLAGTLAERGFIVLRYDKRGVGQSGGRSETVTLDDYADDAISAVKWLARRDGVDKKRITVVGHSEGGAVALIAASREKKISSLVLISAPGTTGADLVLAQQQHLLEALKLPEAERQATIDLQKKIQTAVTTEKGWEGIPADMRKQADTPWFRSFLLFDPAKAMKKVRQPMLIVQGDLDTQVAPANADRLAELARGRKKKVDVRVEHLPGVNHLLVHAVTGEVSEYPSLKEKQIVPDVARVISEWLKK